MAFTGWPRHVCGAVFIFGCQHVDDIAEVGSAPVTPSLAEPEVALPSVQMTAFEDRPPPEPPPQRPMTPARRWFFGLSRAERSIVRQICREGANDPCFGMLPRRVGSAPTKMSMLFAQLDANGMSERVQVSNYCVGENPRLRCDTPLVIAFAGERVAFEASDAMFAFHPGVAVHTDWPTAATPWIALDRDGDGAITNGSELFGDASPGAPKNGFEAIAALDANRDSVIDREDPLFERLVLWADRDGDRKSSPAELSPLADVVIAIPLAHEVAQHCTRGNCEGERGAVRWRDESGNVRTGAVIDVYLQRR